MVIIQHLFQENYKNNLHQFHVREPEFQKQSFR